MLVFQMCQMQAELEEEWKERSRQALASAKEHHSAELAELAEHRDLLQEQLTELQQKVRTGSLLQSTSSRTTEASAPAETCLS